MKTAEIFGTVVTSTEMAVLFDFGGDESVWVPRSVMDNDGQDYNDGDSDNFLIYEWYAVKEGLV